MQMEIVSNANTQNDINFISFCFPNRIKRAYTFYICLKLLHSLAHSHWCVHKQTMGHVPYFCERAAFSHSFRFAWKMGFQSSAPWWPKILTEKPNVLSEQLDAHKRQITWCVRSHEIWLCVVVWFRSLNNCNPTQEFKFWTSVATVTQNPNYITNISLFSIALIHSLLVSVLFSAVYLALVEQISRCDGQKSHSKFKMPTNCTVKRKHICLLKISSK